MCRLQSSACLVAVFAWLLVFNGGTVRKKAHIPAQLSLPRSSIVPTRFSPRVPVRKECVLCQVRTTIHLRWQIEIEASGESLRGCVLGINQSRRFRRRAKGRPLHYHVSGRSAFSGTTTTGQGA